MPIRRPITVMIAQGLLALAALFYLAVPFLVVASSTRTLDYYGIGFAKARFNLALEFLLWLAFVTPVLVAIGIASWGMARGSRLGRLLLIAVFTLTACSLLFDVIDPSDSLRMSYLGVPAWAEISLKLTLAFTFVVFDMLISYGHREKAFFAGKAHSPVTEPPPPPTFDD